MMRESKKSTSVQAVKAWENQLIQKQNELQTLRAESKSISAGTEQFDSALNVARSASRSIQQEQKQIIQCLRSFTIVDELKSLQEQLDAENKNPYEFQDELKPIQDSIKPLQSQKDRILRQIAIFNDFQEINGLQALIEANRIVEQRTSREVEDATRLVSRLETKIANCQIRLDAKKEEQRRADICHSHHSSYHVQPFGYHSHNGHYQPMIVPVIHDLSESYALGSAVRELETELSGLENQKSRAELNVRMTTNTRQRLQDQYYGHRTTILAITSRIDQNSATDKEAARCTSLKSLQDGLKAVNEALAPFEKSRNIINVKIQAKRQRIDTLRDQIATLNDEATENAVDNPYVGKTKAELEALSTDAESRKEKALEDVARARTVKSNHATLIAENARKIAAAQQAIDILESYAPLMELRNQPRQALYNLVNVINLNLVCFEIEFPAHQSPRLQRILLQMKGALVTINPLDDKQQDVVVPVQQPQLIFSDNSLARQQYFALCGMLIDLQNKWGAEAVLFAPTVEQREELTVENVFRARLEDILNVNFNDADYCLGAYQSLKVQPIEPEEIERVQDANYIQYHNEVARIADAIPAAASPVLVRLKQLCVDFRTEVDADTSIGQSHKIILMRETSDLLTKAATGRLDGPDIARFEALARHNNPEGRPSIGWKIAGIMLAITGIIAVAVGLLAEFKSLLIATPLAKPVIAGGSAAIMTGLGLFLYGNRSCTAVAGDQMLEGLRQMQAEQGDPAPLPQVTDSRKPAPFQLPPPAYDNNLFGAPHKTYPVVTPDDNQFHVPANDSIQPSAPPPGYGS